MAVSVPSFKLSAGPSRCTFPNLGSPQFSQKGLSPGSQPAREVRQGVSAHVVEPRDGNIERSLWKLIDLPGR